MSKIMHRSRNKNKNPQSVKQRDAPPPNRTKSPCRILVVDQNRDFRLLCADALARPGCRVDVAKNGSAAWKALQARHYQLLITENKLPDLTGDELIRKLRCARMDVQVVVVAGGLPSLELPRNPTCSCAAMLLKPFELATLLNTVKNALPALVQDQEAKKVLQSSRNLDRAAVGTHLFREKAIGLR